MAQEEAQQKLYNNAQGESHSNKSYIWALFMKQNLVGFICTFSLLISLSIMGSVAGPVIKANGRLTFEDDLRSGGPLCFITQ